MDRFQGPDSPKYREESCSICKRDILTCEDISNCECGQENICDDCLTECDLCCARLCRACAVKGDYGDFCDENCLGIYAIDYEDESWT